MAGPGGQGRDTAPPSGGDPARRLPGRQLSEAPRPAGLRPQSAGRRRRGSDRSDVGRLKTLRALRGVELDLLVLFEIAEATPRDRAEMDEHVRSATVLGDEAEALLAVEPLHFAGCHERSPPFLA